MYVFFRYFREPVFEFFENVLHPHILDFHHILNLPLGLKFLRLSLKALRTRNLFECIIISNYLKENYLPNSLHL